MRFSLLALCWPLVSFLLVAQDAPKPNPDSQAITEAVEGLKKAQKEKLEQDQIHFIKILAEKWANVDDKSRREVLNLAERNFKAKGQDVRDATVESLSKMTGGEKDRDAEEATKILIEERGKKSTEENPTYFGLVCVAIGKLHHAKGVPVLTKLMQYKDFDVVAAAAEGLGHYRDAPIDLKKEVVESLLKAYTGASNQYARDPRDSTAKERVTKISPAMEISLKALTGRQDITKSDAWWKWWNDTGKKAKSW